jgi:protein-tyrosine phosphatase
MERVLFICTGNYYRSRFAEALFNYEAERQALAWRAFSRGLATWMITDGSRLSPDTIEALEARGIPLSYAKGNPTPLVAEDFHSARRIIALKQDEHLPLMKRQFPAWAERIDYWHVHDKDFAMPEEAVPEIETRVQALLRDLARPLESSPSDA